MSAHVWLRSVRSRRLAVVAAATVAAVFASSLVSLPRAQAAPKPGDPKAAVAPDKSVPVSKVPVKAPAKADPNAVLTRQLPTAVWPQAGSADSDGTGAGIAPGGLPVRVTGTAAVDVAPRTRAELTGTAKQKPVPVRVTLADQQAAAAAGVRGVVFTVARTDGVPGPARVGVSVDYTTVAAAYGADYGSRLRLVTLPDCALSTPSVPACQTQTPLGSTNDVSTRSVTAQQLTVGSASTSSTVVALSNSPSGTSSQANWTATDLSPAYSWASGTAGGDFTLNYPMRAPASLGGPQPAMSLSYSAGGVDAKTAAKTGQPSVVGEGWDLSGSGYVERTFRTCAEDGSTGSDLCWVNAGAVTMVFGGRSVELVKDASNVWHASSDDGLRIESVLDSTSAHNNAVGGEYWKVTTQDGTQYYFGKLHRYVGDSADTGSVQTEPVVGNNAGDSCNPSWCQQAYRWNLDYVVDPRGNSMTYFYDKLPGRYGSAGIPYDLSATLNRIEYGTRAGSEGSSTAPMRLQFDYAQRCWNSCIWPTSGYSDTPGDLYCDPNAASCSNVATPVHFTRWRLSAVTTQLYTGSGTAYRNVDKWDLDQTFLLSGDNILPAGADTPPNLWLTGLTHTGYAADGVTSQAEPQVTFDPVLKANRTDWGNALGMAPFMHGRISQVNNGVGGQTIVDYADPDYADANCVNGAPKINSDSNPSRCFPMYYKGPQSNPDFGYFNKYVVESVTEHDVTGGSPDEVTSYTYSSEGSSDTALWAHDDVDIANVAQTSWADWRGYPTVTTTHGTVAGQQTVSKTVYHRGLHGDAKKSGDDTQVLYAQRPAFTLEALQPAAEIPVGVAGGGTVGAGSQCLDILNAVNADGTALQVTGCNGLDWQKWIRRFDTSLRPTLQNPVTGKCVDVKTSGTSNGTQVWLYTCNNGAAQVWMRQPDGSLKNPNSGKCLDVAGNSLQPGGTMQIWDCNGLWSQVFMPTAKGELVRSQAVRCATAAGTGEGSALQSQMCGTMDSTANQTWQLQRNGSVVNPGTGKCMDVQTSGTANGTIVQLWTCNQGAAQQWLAQNDGSLKNPNSGRCLDAEGNAGLFIYDCNSRLSQKWVGRTQDHSALQGQVRASYTMNNGAVDSFAVHRYITPLTTSRAAYTTPGANIYSFMTRENQIKTATWIAATSSWRWTQTDTTYDSYGLPTDVNNWADVASSTDDMCTHTDYARNTGSYLVAFPSQSVTTDCAGSPHDGNYLQGVQMLYDGSTTLGAAPTQGMPTQSNALTNAAGTTLTWTKQGRSTYDQYGRLQDGFDALEHKTMTRYTPASGGPVTATTVTNPLGHVQVKTVEPGHGTATTVLDANNQTTTAQYDPLGRLGKVWLPGRATNLSANAEYTYTLSATAPSVVTAKKLGPNGNQITTTALHDGRLRLRQTQAPAAQAKGGRVVTDTQYDARGLAWQQTRFWDATTAPTTALAGFSNSSVQQQTRSTFDRLQRPTATGLYAADALKWQSTTSYDGDSITAVPPNGGVPTKQTFDAAGRVTSLRQYTAGTVAGAFQDTSYEYDHLGRRTKVTDPAGNQWTTTFDRLGRVTAGTDPDAGSTSAIYDNAGRVTSSTDARGTLAYTYDDLDRKTGVYEGTTAGTKRAGWLYDTLWKGALTSATRYVGILPFTTTVGGYDVQGRPLSTSTGIPIGANLPAGTYTSSATYNVDGSLATTTYPGAGGLPQETVSYTYDNTGRSLSMTGLDTYVADTSYYGFGPAYQEVLGSGTKHIRNTATIDEATGRLSAALTETQNQTTTSNWDPRLNQIYAYDPAGNVTAIAETSSGAVVANECFKYDGLRQLTEAWTTAAATCQTTPTQASVGGAEAYWTSYQHQQSTGNRTTETKHATSGDTTRTYTYPANGATSVRPHTITSVASTGAVTSTDSYTYDAAGGMKTRTIAAGPNQTMTWDPEGHVSTVTDATGTTNYTYDAGGARLVAADPQGTTVYLAGFELRLQNGSTSATRYYGGVAVRTTGGGLSWLSTDHHGTGTLAIDATTLATTRRRLDPYGNPRTTTAVTWPSNRGFVNGVIDNTGLTHLGAREYEPTTGRFISDDPITDTNDPQQMNGYTYASNNPTTGADPSGLRNCTGPEDCGGDKTHGNPGYGNGSSPDSSADDDDACRGNCHKHRPSTSQGGSDTGPSQEDIDKANKLKETSVLDVIVSVGGQILLDLLGVTDIVNCFTKGDIGACVMTLVNFIPWGQLFKAAKIGKAAWKVGRAVVTWLGEAKWAERVLADAERVATKADDLAHCVRNSFKADTPVVMADGRRKLIADVKLGDQVVATDPGTATTGPRTVIVLHRNEDTALTDLQLTADGDHVDTIHTTQGHPFWSDTRQRWVNAGHLQVGERLRTLDGTDEVVVSRVNTIGTATMYNLTIADVHTYYVMVGTTPVLVHNGGGDDEDIYDKYSQYDDYEDDPSERKMMRGDNQASNRKARYQERQAGITNPEQREKVHREIGERKIGGNENVGADDLREAIEDAGGTC